MRFYGILFIEKLSSGSRCHLEQSLPFPTTVDAICNIYVNGTAQVAGVVIVYRTRMLAVKGSKYSNSFFIQLLFSFFYLVSSFRTNFGLD